VGTAYETAVRQKNRNMKIEILPDLLEVGTRPGYSGYPQNEMLSIYSKLFPAPKSLLGRRSLSLGKRTKTQHLKGHADVWIILKEVFLRVRNACRGSRNI
jgi:hypothetical protein